MARGLTWYEVDFYLQGYETRRQEELAGHRMVATRIHNLFPGEEGPLTEAEYHFLPLVDKPVLLPTPAKSMDEWRAELAAQNAKTLAARAAPSHA